MIIVYYNESGNITHVVKGDKEIIVIDETTPYIIVNEMIRPDQYKVENNELIKLF